MTNRAKSEARSQNAEGRSGGLDTRIQYLKGIGPKRAALFAKVGVETVGQLLFHVPVRYIDRSKTLPIRHIRPGDEVTVFGKVVTAGERRMRNFRKMVACVVGDSSGMVEAIWFNRPDLAERFEAGQELMLSGKVTEYRGKQFVNPSFEILEPGGEFSRANAIIPVYPLTEGLSVWTIRRAVSAALEKYGDLVAESLSREIRQHYSFPDVMAALEAIHFPTDVRSAERGRSRLAYEELFYFELVLALRRRQNALEKKGSSLSGTGRLTGAFRQALAFRLTAGQERVVAEIVKDMAEERCMNRLLQGDVGSGKTVVALYAMLVACESGAQAAMMAPTEILASQHYAGWAKKLDSIGVSARLLTGSTRPAERREILSGLVSGAVQMIFGTHALIEEGVKFARLGLVVVDEQHRFGVLQRAALLSKGLNPDFLVMTATPIPRTLTLTLYGDLDVSLLKEKPEGRIPPVTRIVTEEKRARVYEYIEQQLAKGEQAFVVCPLIEESEKLDLASATKTFNEVCRAFPARRAGLVHGRMKPEDRDKVMERLRNRELDILVSTTVIEVGVDVPGASIMLIEHPERFGLAQLHQLRGRIGRAGQRSICILVTNPQAAESSERLAFFASTTDGFALAEKDMETRGPGEILGTRQHGLPDLRVADLSRDRALLDDARKDAFRLIEIDPELTRIENERVRKTLLSRYRGRARLSRVG